MKAFESTPNCKGIVGWWRGHDYEEVHETDYGPAPHPLPAVEGSHVSMNLPDQREVEERHLYNICSRCGHVVKHPAKEATP